MPFTLVVTLTHPNIAYLLLEIETVVSESEVVPSVTVESTAHIRSGVNCGQLRPLHRNRLRHPALDVVHLLSYRSDETGDSGCLGSVIDLAAEERIAGSEAIDLLLHVTLLEVAEFLDHSGLKVGDSIYVALSAEGDGVSERVGLLDSAELILVALGCNLLLGLAAALAQLGSESRIALLDGVDYLLAGKTDGGANLLDGALDSIDRKPYAVDVAVEGCSKEADVCIRPVDRVHNHLRVRVGGSLCSERSCSRSAIAVSSPAEAVAPAAEETRDQSPEYTSENAGAEAAASEESVTEAIAVTKAIAVIKRPHCRHTAPTALVVSAHNYRLFVTHFIMQLKLYISL